MKRSFKEFNKMWEDAAANSAGGGGIAGIGIGPDGEPGLNKAQMKKHKKRVQQSDGRTKEGKQFIRRILDRSAAKEAKKMANQQKINADSIKTKS